MLFIEASCLGLGARHPHASVSHGNPTAPPAQVQFRVDFSASEGPWPFGP